MSKSSAIEFLLGGRGSLCLNSSSFSQISFKTSDFYPGDTLSKVYKVKVQSIMEETYNGVTTTSISYVKDKKLVYKIIAVRKD